MTETEQVQIVPKTAAGAQFEVKLFLQKAAEQLQAERAVQKASLQKRVGLLIRYVGS